jgi:cysteine desulfurase/selenocysteine lyase
MVPHIPMTDLDDSRRRIYLDNAATSWPKPEAVYRAVEHYQRHLGAPAGRGAYEEAVAASQAVAATRSTAAHFLGLDAAERLIFASNGTDALNLAIHGLLREGDHVVTTVTEHNSVLRPLEFLRRTCGVSVSHARCDSLGYVDPHDVRAAMRPSTRLVAVSLASNVTGAVQDVAAMAEIAREHDALLLCDAAQAAGHLAVDLGTLGADLLAAPGHKGLLGPLGTGVLAMSERAAAALHSVRQGGTGTQSDAINQPNELPEKFESGNLNVPGIVGLGSGIEFLEQSTVEAIQQRGHALTRRLIEGLRDIRGVRLLGPPADAPRVPLVSVVLAGYDPQEAASILDSVYRVQVRSGLHCAPLMHRALGTEQGGSLRFSLGAFNTLADVEVAVKAIADIVSAHVTP